MNPRGRSLLVFYKKKTNAASKEVPKIYESNLIYKNNVIQLYYYVTDVK